MGGLFSTLSPLLPSLSLALPVPVPGVKLFLSFCILSFSLLSNYTALSCSPAFSHGFVCPYVRTGWMAFFFSCNNGDFDSKVYSFFVCLYVDICFSLCFWMCGYTQLLWFQIITIKTLMWPHTSLWLQFFSSCTFCITGKTFFCHSRLKML